MSNSKRTFLGSAMAAVMSVFSSNAQEDMGRSAPVTDTIKRWTGTEDIRINASSGRLRAARRLRLHKAQWDNTPTSDVITRQRQRRYDILIMRQRMTIAKRKAMSQLMGGAAVIRTPLDMHRVYD